MPRHTTRPQPPSGLPKSIKPLWEQGQRIRYSGFWLDGSVRDRLIAEYLDSSLRGTETGDSYTGHRIIEFIKDRLYELASGQVSLDGSPHNVEALIQIMEAVQASTNQISDMIRSGRMVVSTTMEEEIDRAGQLSATAAANLRKLRK